MSRARQFLRTSSAFTCALTLYFGSAAAWAQQTDGASSQPQTPATSPLVSPEATSAEGSAPTPSADPFFEKDFDAAFQEVDTEWRKDDEIAKTTAVFVGPKSAYSRLKELIKHDEMSLLLKSRLLVSVQSDQDTRSDGFELLQLRAVVSGKLDHGFAYYTQVEAAGSPALVDAYVSYHPVNWLGLTLGRMKIPFAKEYITSRTSLTFIDRSEVVLLTAPKRGVGALLSGELWDKRLNYRLGVYNGTGMQALDWGRQLLGAARVEAIPLQTSLGRFQLSLAFGANAAYGMAESLDFSQIAVLGDVGVFEGARALGGADLKLQLGPLWFATEGVYAHYESRHSPLTFDVSGGYAELGASLMPDRVDVMARYDALWVPATDALNQFAIAGLRVFASEFFIVQLNYAWGFGSQSSRPQGLYWSRNQLIAAFQLLL